MIRAATTCDIPRLMAIRAAVRENRLSDPARIGAAHYDTYIRQGCCWVWQGDNCVLGFAALEPALAQVWALFVMPDAEGRGIGRTLLQHMVQAAHDRGDAQLVLTTAEGSRAAEFYRRAGWSVRCRSRDAEIEMHLDLGKRAAPAGRPLLGSRSYRGA